MGPGKNHTPCGQRAPQDKSPHREIRHLHAAPLPHTAYSAEKAWAARKGIGDMEGHWRHGRASQGIKHLLLYLLQLVFHLHHDILHLSLIAL